MRFEDCSSRFDQYLLSLADLTFDNPKWTAQETQYTLTTASRAIYVPCDRSSRANDGSTREVHRVSRFALSLGTGLPQFEHWIISLRPLPPLLRPRDFRFLVNHLHCLVCWLRTCFKRCELCCYGLVGFRKICHFCGWFAAEHTCARRGLIKGYCTNRRSSFEFYLVLASDFPTPCAANESASLG